MPQERINRLTIACLRKHSNNRKSLCQGLNIDIILFSNMYARQSTYKNYLHGSLKQIGSKLVLPFVWLRY